MSNNVVRLSFSGQRDKASKQQSRPPAATDRAKPPRKPKNVDVRDREHLKPEEIEDLLVAIKGNRKADRDYLLIRMMYAHGLRVLEAINLKWNDVDFKRHKLQIRRAKNGDDAIHPINGDILRRLRKLAKQSRSPFIFATGTGDQLTEAGAFKIIRRAGEKSGLPFVHPHMLRHSCGYTLINSGTDLRFIQAYLGHKNIQHTVRYTALSESRFNGVEKLF